jgi:hypothetical protein
MSDIKCQFCLMTFKSPSNLEQHQKHLKTCSNYKYVQFVCRKCGFATRGIRNIDEHMKHCQETLISEDPIGELRNKVEKLEQKLEEKLEEKSEQKLEHKLEEKSEHKLEEKSEQKLEEKSEQKLEHAATDENKPCKHDKSPQASYNEQDLIEVLKVERLKNKLFRHIIEKNTSIKIDDVFMTEKDDIHIYNTIDGDIPIFLHDTVKSNDGFVILHTNDKRTKTLNKPQTKKISNGVSSRKETGNTEVKVVLPCILEKTKEQVTKVETKENLHDTVNEEQKEPKKQHYRPVKKIMTITKDITEEDIKHRIEIVDATVLQEQKTTIDIENVYKQMENIFNKLKTSRIYTKLLDELRSTRMSIFCSMTVKEYTKILEEHISKLETIFKDKNYPVKKITSIVVKGLYAIESRILGYYNYTSQHLDTDEIQTMKFVYENGKLKDKGYVPFDIDRLADTFCNYGLVLYPLKTTLKSLLFNFYGFNSIIYLPVPKSKDSDPYSFYTLEKVNKEKRYWKMDCRLEYFSSILSMYLLPYAIGMFRRLYKDVFNDNDFRPNYNTKCQLTECDCEQLLHNIFLLAQGRAFCNTLRHIVKEYSTYTPTDNDKFNLYGDDSLQRKRFQEKEEPELLEVVKQLFDGISSSQAVDFYRDRIA